MGRTESKTRGADGGRVPVVGRQRSRRLRIIGEHEWTHGLKNHWKLGSFTKKTKEIGPVLIGAFKNELSYCSKIGFQLVLPIYRVVLSVLKTITTS
jgi:hypothetical protein